MPCTSLCSSGGRLMRRTSPWTRIIGGSPAERCRSDALFLTEKASNSEMSIYNPWPAKVEKSGSGQAVRPGATEVEVRKPENVSVSHQIMSHITENLQAVHATIVAAA